MPAYEREPYRTEFDATVIRSGEEDGRPFAVLNDTILYPEGGGQPSDRGTLNQIAVLDVQKADGEVKHFLTSPIPCGPVKVKLDWARRFDHMQQHTGQHVLTAVAQERFGWETTAFHLGEDRCDIELATPSLTQQDQVRLEDAVSTEIRAGRIVAGRRVTLEDYQGMAVRSRGLPEGHSGAVRLVEIAGLDLNTCGGTHLRNTAELECLKLLGTEILRGGTRLFFVVGTRVRRRLGEHEKRNAALRTLLGAPDEELVAMVEAKLDQIRVMERRIRQMEDEQTAWLLERLATVPEALVEQHFEAKDAGFIQKLARQVVASAPGKLVFFTSTQEEASCFVLAAGEQLALDLAALGKEIAGILDAKGGGAKGFFQGKCGNLSRRNEAVVRLSGTISGRLGAPLADAEH